MPNIFSCGSLSATGAAAMRGGFGMRSRLLILALSAGMLVPTAARATPPPPESSAGAGQRAAGVIAVAYRAQGGAVQREMARPGLAGLPSRPDPEQLRAAWLEQMGVAAADGEPGGSADLVEVVGAPDLDADGKRDLVSIHMDGDNVTFSGLRGATGTALWEHAEPGQYGFIQRARVGTDGAPGLIATSVTFEGGDDPENPNFTTTTVITALAADGRDVWSHTYHGSGSAAPTGFAYQGITYTEGVGNLTASAADDLLLTTLDGTETPLGSSAHAQIQVIDGSDGSTAAMTDVVAAEGWISASIVGDLDGDSLQDFVTAASQSGGQNTVAAHRGTDGAALWQTTSDGGLVGGVREAGDIDGDAITDVMLLSLDLESFSGTATLLSGVDGAWRWSTPGDVAIVVRDISGDGLSDILVQRVYDGFGSHSSRNANGFGVRYVMRSGVDGSLLYRRTYTVEFGDHGGMGMVGLYGAVGDVDGDRRADMGHEATVMSFDGTSQDNSGVVRSRDGRRTLKRGFGTPLFARVDARGEDFAVTDQVDGLLRVRVRDGRTGKRIWQRMLPGSASADYIAVSAADVIGNRRAELVVVVPRRSGPMIYVLRSGRGKTLWRR